MPTVVGDKVDRPGPTLRSPVKMSGQPVNKISGQSIKMSSPAEIAAERNLVRANIPAGYVYRLQHRAGKWHLSMRHHENVTMLNTPTKKQTCVELFDKLRALPLAHHIVCPYDITWGSYDDQGPEHDVVALEMEANDALLAAGAEAKALEVKAAAAAAEAEATAEAEKVAAKKLSELGMLIKAIAAPGRRDAATAAALATLLNN
jgi:hypothetical protein